jgi:hypothetical protein
MDAASHRATIVPDSRSPWACKRQQERRIGPSMNDVEFSSKNSATKHFRGAGTAHAAFVRAGRTRCSRAWRPAVALMPRRMDTWLSFLLKGHQNDVKQMTTSYEHFTPETSDGPVVRA